LKNPPIYHLLGTASKSSTNASGYPKQVLERSDSRIRQAGPRFESDQNTLHKFGLFFATKRTVTLNSETQI